MNLSRRDFMKLVGVSVASLALTRCNNMVEITPTCYTQVAVDWTPSSTPPPDSLDARGRLRFCWLRFDELGRAVTEQGNRGSTDNIYGQQLIVDHQAALVELIEKGDLTPSVADLIQEAYEAAINHVWRSNISLTCYTPSPVNYLPPSADILVQQSEMLRDYAEMGEIDAETLENARAALEHDMAFYALKDDEVTALYDRIISDWQALGQYAPPFEDLELEITPDAQAAAQFIISLLTDNPSN